MSAEASKEDTVVYDHGIGYPIRMKAVNAVKAILSREDYNSDKFNSLLYNIRDSVNDVELMWVWCVVCSECKETSSFGKVAQVHSIFSNQILDTIKRNATVGRFVGVGPDSSSWLGLWEQFGEEE